MTELRRPVDEIADELARRAAAVREAMRMKLATSLHLDEVLPAHGYWCFHDCRLPGGESVIDHVVVGPSGVWLLDDKRLPGAVTINAEGEAWSGRYPLSPVIGEARVQAAALDAAIGGILSKVVLTVHGGPVPGGAVERDGVVMAAGPDRTGAVIRHAPATLTRPEIDRVALQAKTLLNPHKSSAPSNAQSSHPVVPDTIPSWMVEPKTPVVDTSHVGEQTVKRVDRYRSRRSMKGAIIAIAALAAAVLAYQRVSDALDGTPAGFAVAVDSSPKTGTPALAMTFECRNPGGGWTAVARWTAIGGVDEVWWSSSADGPWAPTAPFGDSAAREGVTPKQAMFVRVATATASGVAPADSC